jgi:cell division septum initiation protein DivIVA
METISNKKERVTRITRMVSQLSAKEQTELLKRLEQKLMIEKAQKLAEGVTKNSLSMADIVNEVRKVRQNK